MKKIIALFLAVLLLCGLTGCAGVTVVVGECDHEVTAEPAVENVAEGAVKTGLAVMTNISDSVSAAEEDGAAKYDVTLAAVAIDDEGIIRACAIDSVPATVSFNAAGEITSDVTAQIRTKNEQGADYGMVAWGGAIAEWDAQVASLAEFAVGKTVEELKSGAIDETGKAPAGSDLASSATIYLGGYVAAIEAAAANAQHLGAQAGDELVLTTMASTADSTSASEEAAGNAQLNVDIAVLTRKDGVITSCYIDSLQAKIAFDAAGAIITDLTAPVSTKNELGADYGMVAWGGAIAEWNEQAASYAAYITGLTAEEVAGIAISETTKPADGSDLASSVTIAIGGFQALIAKALAQ